MPAFASRPLIIWGVVLLCGILFRTLHWPGGMGMIFFSSAGMLAYTTSGLITYRGSDNFIVMMFVLSMIIFLVLLYKRYRNGHFDIMNDSFYFIIFGVYLAAYEILKKFDKWKLLISSLAFLILVAYLMFMVSFRG